MEKKGTDWTISANVWSGSRDVACNVSTMEDVACNVSTMEAEKISFPLSVSKKDVLLQCDSKLIHCKTKNFLFQILCN